MNPCAKFFILVGPSGVGKSTLIKQLAEHKISFAPLITHTTRTIRPGEIHTQDYFFISNEEYLEKKANNEFMFPVSHYGNHYGICKKYINEKLTTGNHLIGSLTGNVAKQMISFVGDNVITIFIAPPSFESLQERLSQRKTETETSMQIRLSCAQKELQEQYDFDHHIINDDLDQTTKKLIDILKKESLR